MTALRSGACKTQLVADCERRSKAAKAPMIASRTLVSFLACDPTPDLASICAISLFPPSKEDAIDSGSAMISSSFVPFLLLNFGSWSTRFHASLSKRKIEVVAAVDRCPAASFDHASVGALGPRGSHEEIPL